MEVIGINDQHASIRNTVQLSTNGRYYEDIARHLRGDHNLFPGGRKGINSDYRVLFDDHRGALLAGDIKVTDL